MAWARASWRIATPPCNRWRRQRSISGGSACAFIAASLLAAGGLLAAVPLTGIARAAVGTQAADCKPIPLPPPIGRRSGSRAWPRRGR